MGLFRRTAVPTAPPPPSDDQILTTLAAAALAAVAEEDGWISLTADEERQLIFAQHEARRRGLF